MHCIIGPNFGRLTHLSSTFLVPAISLELIVFSVFSFLCIYLSATLYAIQKSIFFIAKELDYLVYFVGQNTLHKEKQYVGF